MALSSLALEGAWLAGRARLAFSRKHHQLPPAGLEHAAYLTSVVRVPADIAGRLEPVLERLRAHGPQHHYYEQDSLHVTIRNLDSLADDDLAAARAAIASHPPFELEARGLNLSLQTVFAAVRPADGTLRSLRRALAELTGAKPGALADVAFANVVRFSGRVEPGFVRELARMRRVELGSWLVREVELVRTDRLLSPEGTQVLDRVRLGAWGR